jgi:hypothetical protein
MADRKDDRSTWAIGGGLLLGLGVGFFFLNESALAFVGSMGSTLKKPKLYGGIPI